MNILKKFRGQRVFVPVIIITLFVSAFAFSGVFTKKAHALQGQPVVNTFSTTAGDSPITGTVGMSPTLTWTSTNADSCDILGGSSSFSPSYSQSWPGLGANGSQNVGPLNKAGYYVFTITCTNDSTSQTATHPEVNIQVNGGTGTNLCSNGTPEANLTWFDTNPPAPYWSIWREDNGGPQKQIVSPYYQLNYTDGPLSYNTTYTYLFYAGTDISPSQTEDVTTGAACAPATATINVTQSPVSGGTWSISSATSGPYTTTPNTVPADSGGTQYNLTCNSAPTNYTCPTSVAPITAFPGGNYTFTINYSPTPGHLAPTVSAGPDIPITLPTSSVSVTGTATYNTPPAGSITSTTWSFISGPGTPSIATPSSLTTSITGMTTAGTYVFRLTAQDSQFASNSDDMQVVVSPAAMSGTISATNCTIASGASACNSSVTWNTTNPQGTSAVTSSYPAANTTLANGNTGNFVQISIPFQSSPRVLSLYNNSVFLNSATATATCTGSTSWSGSACTAGGTMSGTLTPVNPTCTVASGASSCTELLTWTTTNPVATSQVTSPLGTPSPGPSTNNGSATFTAPYNVLGINFFLYNNGIQLAQTNVSTDCTSGTSWNGTICANNAVPTVTLPTFSTVTTTGATLGATVTSLGVPASISARGTCWGTTAAPTTNCTPEGGTSTGAFTQPRTGMTANTTYFFRGYATNTTGTGYSTDGTFTTAALAMSGTLTSSAPSCTIASGASNCSVNLTWSTTNPQGTSAVTSDYPSAGTTVFSGNNGGPSAVTIPFSSRVFYLYNNTILLNPPGLTVTSSCTSGTSWNGTICANNAVPTVTLPTFSTVTTTGATLGATVTSLGVPASISARGTCWGTTAAPTTNCTPEGGTSTGAFTQPRTGMTANTTYFFRGYATNTTGTGYSTDGTFTTSSAAVMSGTLSGSNCTIALNASTCTTTLSWTVTNPEVVLGSNVTSNTDNTGASSPNFVIAPPVTTGTVDSGTKTGVIITGTVGSRTFFLNNNAKSLYPTSPSGSGLVVTSSCASGTWDGSKCSSAGFTAGTDLLASAPTQTTATANVAQTYTSTISNNGTTGTGVSFPNIFQTSSAPDGSANVTDYLVSPNMSALAGAGSAGSSAVSTSPPITLPAGTWYIRACANKSDRNTFGPVVETSYLNNCSAELSGSWTTVTVSVPLTPTASLNCSPNPIAVGNSSVCTWSSSNATSCTETGGKFATGGLTTGNASVSPLTTTTYEITCTNGSTNSAPSDFIVTVGSASGKKPIFKEN